jgi:hypothetical protein
MASDKEDGEVTQYESVYERGGKRRHCKRFWWIYVLTFLVIATVVVVPVV